MTNKILDKETQRKRTATAWRVFEYHYQYSNSSTDAYGDLEDELQALEDALEKMEAARSEVETLSPETDQVLEAAIDDIFEDVQAYKHVVNNFWEFEAEHQQCEAEYKTSIADEQKFKEYGGTL